MSERHPNIVQAADLPWIDTSGVKRATSPGDQDRGHQFAAQARPLSKPAGGVRLGCTLYELASGRKSFPFHYHLGNEEAIYILEGAVTLRLGDREIALRAGDYAAFPPGPGHAHQLINASGATVRYLCLSTNDWPEIAVYPDSNKVGMFGGPPGDGSVRQFHRLGETLPYYDGEDR